MVNSWRWLWQKLFIRWRSNSCKLRILRSSTLDALFWTHLSKLTLREVFITCSHRSRIKRNWLINNSLSICKGVTVLNFYKTSCTRFVKAFYFTMDKNIWWSLSCTLIFHQLYFAKTLSSTLNINGISWSVVNCILFETQFILVCDKLILTSELVINIIWNILIWLKLLNPWGSVWSSSRDQFVALWFFN